MAGRLPEPRWYWIYILQTRGGRYYTGYTEDLARRYRQHRMGDSRCRFTRGFPPEGVARCWRVYGTRGVALRIEALIKRQNRRAKERLIQEPGGLARLVRRGLGLKTPIRAARPNGAPAAGG